MFDVQDSPFPAQNVYENRSMGILPMSTTGILPVVFPDNCRAKRALRLTGRMPVLRWMPVLIHVLSRKVYHV